MRKYKKDWKGRKMNDVKKRRNYFIKINQIDDKKQTIGRYNTWLTVIIDAVNSMKPTGYTHKVLDSKYLFISLKFSNTENGVNLQVDLSFSLFQHANKLIAPLRYLAPLILQNKYFVKKLIQRSFQFKTIYGFFKLKEHLKFIILIIKNFTDSKIYIRKIPFLLYLICCSV